MRIGTALINGSWFVGACRASPTTRWSCTAIATSTGSANAAGLLIVSAPSPVMEATDDEDTYFYIHTLAVGSDGKLKLLEPERVAVRGRRVHDDFAVVRVDPEQADPE